MANETLLAISGPGISPFSARGLSQTLEPIAQTANVRRTINAAAVDVSAPQFRKYKSDITCTDQVPPAFQDVWPGTILTVDCAAYLSYKTSGGAPARTVVPDSAIVEGEYTRYRPRLTMMVMGPWQSTESEYGAEVQWSLPLEEV